MNKAKNKNLALKNRFLDCVSRLAEDLENNYCIDSSILIAVSKINKRKVQLKLTLTSEEDDFLETGFGEVKL